MPFPCFSISTLKRSMFGIDDDTAQIYRNNFNIIELIGWLSIWLFAYFVFFSFLSLCIKLLTLAFSMIQFSKLTNVIENFMNIKGDFTDVLFFPIYLYSIEQSGRKNMSNNNQWISYAIFKNAFKYKNKIIVYKVRIQHYTAQAQIIHFIQIPFYILLCSKMFSFSFFFFGSHFANNFRGEW